MAPNAAPQDNMHAADKEQNPLVTEGERGPIRDGAAVGQLGLAAR